MRGLKHKNNRWGGNIIALRDMVYVIYYGVLCTSSIPTLIICSVLNCNMYVIIICICCLCHVNVILHIRYCNLWMYVCKEYDKYSVSRGTSNNHEIMVNIISTGGEGVWRWTWKFNGGKWYLRCGRCIVGFLVADGGGEDRLCVWVEQK